MKVSVFLGSPRNKGNTARLVDRVRQALVADRHDVETIHLAQLQISPCGECFACQQIKGEPGCCQDDEMQGLYNTIADSDAIILACPVFCWSFPAQIKAFLDRTCCLAKFSEDGTYVSLVENKKCALVVTAGGDEFDGADLVVDAYQRMARFLRMQDLGHLAVANFLSLEILDAPYVVARVDGFCRQIKQALE